MSQQHSTNAIPPRSADTTAEAERVQTELLRAWPSSRRLHRALGLSATVITLARRALSRQRPDMAKRELDLLFVELHYGRQLAEDLRLDLRRRDRRQAAE